MLDSILEAITQLKTFILVSGIGILLVGIFLLISCNKFSWNSKRRKLIGFFYNLQTWDVIALSCCFIKIFLAISFLIMVGRIETVHIIIFVILKIFFIIHRFNKKTIVMDAGLTIVSVIMMLIMNMLCHYLNDIIFDIRIAVVVYILGILLCMYSVYDLFCCCNAVMGKQKNRKVV